MIFSLCEEFDCFVILESDYCDLLWWSESRGVKGRDKGRKLVYINGLVWIETREASALDKGLKCAVWYGIPWKLIETALLWWYSGYSRFYTVINWDYDRSINPGYF